MNEGPYDVTIREAADAMRSGRLSALELTESVLGRIEATEPTLNAYITVTAGLAREQAVQADEAFQAGDDRGPLQGIPFGLKDLYDTAGVPTTGGSDFLRERIPEADAFVVRRLYEAGAVLSGKLGMAEFAMGVTTTNAHYGAVHNPWNPERVSGGSSGGSGVAVAAGSCVASLGSDTGGSIRIPASLCGVVGLKPTYGLVSRTGVLPLSWTLDHVGPLSKTVEDSALILNVIAGHDPVDPGSADVALDDYTSALGRGVEGIRIGVARDPFWLNASDDVVEACERALDLLQSQGATVTTMELPQLANMPAWMSIMHAEAAAYHAGRFATAPERFGADVRERVEGGMRARASEYINDQRLRRHLIEEMREAMQHVDVMISPTTPITAPVIDFEDTHFELRDLTWRHAVLGIPAISVPCGFDGEGLPIGLSVAGRYFDEVTVLRVAHAYEQSTDWHTRRPVVAAG